MRGAVNRKGACCVWLRTQVEALQACARPLDGLGKHVDGLGKYVDGLGKHVICGEY